MLEEVIEMNAIIVRGDRIAMIVKGDTIIYNASAFKSMQGDPLEELVKKLPGVVFNDGGYYVNGERIHMVLINGMELFGHNINAAVELIRSDEVVNVKAYDYHSQLQKEEGDTLKRAGRILDVTTRQKVTVIQNKLLSGAAGVFIESDKQLDQERASYRRFVVGQQDEIWLDHGSNFSDNTPTRQQTRQWSGMLYLEHPVRKLLSYTFISNPSGREVKSKGMEAGVYSTTSSEVHRSRVSTHASESNGMRLPISGEIFFKVGKRDRFWVGLNGKYTRARNKRIDTDAIGNVILTSSTNMHAFDNNNRIEGGISLEWRHNLSTPGSSFLISVSRTQADEDKTGWQIDTTATSVERLWLTREGDMRDCAYDLRAMHTRKVSKTVDMNLIYSFTDSRVDAIQDGFNRLAGTVDTLTTYDYMAHDQVHQLSSNFFYMKGKWNVVARISARIARQMLDEYAYPVNHISRRFNNMLLTATASYKAPVSQFKMEYNKNVLPLSTHDLRDVIDRSDPLHVTVGNPQLKQGIKRAITIEYNIVSVKTASSFELKVDGFMVSNGMATRKYFFWRDTLLTKYDYLMKAGTSLTIKENVDGRRSLGGSLAYSNNIALIESTVSLALDHHYERSPYLNMDQLQVTRTHTTALIAGIKTAFSQLVQFNLTSRTNWQHSSNGEFKLRSVCETLSGDVRMNFARRFWIKGDSRFTLFDPSMPGAFYRELILNGSFSYKFGKKDAGEVALNLYDILNRQKSIEVKMTEDYTSTSTTDLLGRAAYISLRYSF
jgi:hypothetical protein